MSRLEFVSLGEQVVERITLRCVPASDPNPAALYRRRVEAAMSSTADYLCFVDGREDRLLPGFADSMQALADSGLPLGYAAELLHGEPRNKPLFSSKAYISDFELIHHGVVCRVADLQRIDWPQGCYWFEGIAYGTLAANGCEYDPVPRYDWRPGPGGARAWPGTPRAIVNSLRWLQGLPGVHFSRDFR